MQIGNSPTSLLPAHARAYDESGGVLTAVPSSRIAGDAAATSRIGPNAITQLQSVLLGRLGRMRTERIFAATGLAEYLQRSPTRMVDEHEVARLHCQVRRSLATIEAREIMTVAGDRTGSYILANRIPGPVVFALRRLPAAWSARLLINAISRHAWTFTGSGRFEISRRPGRRSTMVARIEHNPVVALEKSAYPICDWHAAVFRRLFRELVDERTEVTETRCCSQGAPDCRFEIRAG